MSIRTMTAVWDSGRYDAGALLVLLAMADYADEEHICRPSVGALARKARLSERQIIRILNGFKADGMITPIGEHRVKSGRPIVIYRINVEALKGDIMSPLPTPKGDIDALKGDIGDTSKVTSMSYDPPMDPPIGPSVDGAATPPPPPAAPPVTVPATAKTMTEQPAIVAYREVFLRTPSKAQMALILAHQIADLDRWRAVCTLWCGRGWNLTNITGMLDLYDHPERLTDANNYTTNLPAAAPSHRPARRSAPHPGASGDPIAIAQRATQWGPEWFDGINDELPPVDVVA